MTAKRSLSIRQGKDGELIFSHDICDFQQTRKFVKEEDGSFTVFETNPNSCGVVGKGTSFGTLGREDTILVGVLSFSKNGKFLGRKARRISLESWNRAEHITCCTDKQNPKRVMAIPVRMKTSRYQEKI